MANVDKKKKETHDKKTKTKHPLIKKIKIKIAFIDEVFILSVGMSANFKCKNEPTHSGHNVRNGHSTGNAFLCK